MAQLFPIVTIGDVGGTAGGPLRRTEVYLTQPAVMANLESAGSRFVLRTTLNFEGITLGDGELTFGGWGEGFLDKRHPHTLLHEAMLSFNAWGTGTSRFSLSAGKGFAPYGTDDPMARPGLKYPTNHHLSQILERWTLNGVWATGGWSIEAGLFGGTEPDGPYDFSNIESFGDSWSGRLTRRWGSDGEAYRWEAATSFGSVVEEHDGEAETTRLWNAKLRHDGAVGAGRLYGLIEASLSDPEDDEGYHSILAEARLAVGRHQPYARVEVATRPEYPRLAGPASDEFFRYDHDDEPYAATDWVITTVAYALEATGAPWSARPFVELQYHRAGSERGSFDPAVEFGTDSFWVVSAGARIFLGGGPMRMGSYGVLDAMTQMNRAMSTMEMEMEMGMGMGMGR
jgi:hypothetical protein